ncbi:hypothetical protein [Brachybacterium alimentarium]|uniref:hypothetical protein n=1 Tax=Brachybacterium alimentarium TaxID=47845 RepID=UPI003FD1A073
MSDPTTRKLAAQVAAHTSWAGTSDRAARTAAARDALAARFETEVDPHKVLDPEERARRAGHARSAYYARLALKRHQAVRDITRATEALNAADTEIQESI